MKKRLFSLILAVLLLAGVAVSAYAETNLNEVKNSVAVLALYGYVDEYQLYLKAGVQERRLSNSYEGVFATGSCFFIGEKDADPQYIVSNYHVIEDYITGYFPDYDFTPDNNYVPGSLVALKRGDFEYEYKYSMRVYYTSSEYDEAYSVAYDNAQDIAVLRLSKPTSKRTAAQLLRPSENMVGQSVYSIGYPAISDSSVVGAVSKWDIGDVSVHTGGLSRILDQQGTGAQRLQTDAQISRGNSGGPLVNSDGAVLGVCVEQVYSDTSNDTEYYAVNIDAVVSLLTQNNIPFAWFTTAEKVLPDVPATTSAPSVPETEALAPAPATSAPVETPTPVETPEPAESPAVAEATPVQKEESDDSSEENNKQLYMIIGAAAAAVIIAALIIILLGRKKKPEEEPSGKRPCVRSLSSQHHGMRVSLENNQVLVGRSPECNIIFAAKTPGVSGTHCSISFEKSTGDFLVTDLKSTYGTFLSTGEKLTPGVVHRLHAGDSFYLGQNSNMLRVELE